MLTSIIRDFLCTFYSGLVIGINRNRRPMITHLYICVQLCTEGKRTCKGWVAMHKEVEKKAKPETRTQSGGKDKGSWWPRWNNKISYHLFGTRQ